MAFDLGSLLQQYVGGAAPTANVQEHFDQVAQNAPPEAVSDGLAAAFHSDSTPPFGQMVGQLFGAGDPNQRAGMLSQLIAGIGPGVLASLAAGGASGGLGSILGRLMPGGAAQASAAGAPPAVTPEQASKVTPAEIEQIAQHAQQQNPGIVEQMSGFYAQHPQLVKGLGAAALAIVMGKMANRSS
ncbi:MAG: hypothetical protein ABI156_10720 [Caldimonas sp.]